MANGSLKNSHIAELHELAAERGIDGYRMLTREQLIAELGGGEQDAGRDEGGGSREGRRRRGGEQRRSRPPRDRDRDSESDADGDQDSGAENPVGGVTVQLYAAGADGGIGGGDDVLVGTTTTDNSTGQYGFNGLLAGRYFVVFTPPAATSAAPANATGDDTNDSDAIGDITLSPITNITRATTIVINTRLSVKERE